MPTLNPSHNVIYIQDNQIWKGLSTFENEIVLIKAYHNNPLIPRIFKEFPLSEENALLSVHVRIANYQQQTSLSNNGSPEGTARDIVHSLKSSLRKTLMRRTHKKSVRDSAWSADHLAAFILKLLLVKYYMCNFIKGIKRNW